MQMKVAIMQPYFFPYIGYFQMIKAVDAFVFYNDVNYIKQGWINRNRLLVNKEAKYITIPLKRLSSFSLIKNIEINPELKEYKTMLKTIEMAYKKAPYFHAVFTLVKEVLNKEYKTLDEITIQSIKRCCEYLDIKTQFYIASKDFANTKGLERVERLQTICKQLNANHYINALGGQELYTKEDFAKENIQLQFIQSKPINYQQFNNEFVPWLSIIDVLMFNSKEEIKELLNQFELIK
jgi:hypothetical protein